MVVKFRSHGTGLFALSKNIKVKQGSICGLRRDRNNIYDANCIQILAPSIPCEDSTIGGFYTVGEHIGHLSKEIARIIAPLFDCINASGNYIFKPKVQIKGYYTDGHNRPDVLSYRDNVFLPQMEIYERRMRQYDGPDMTDVKEPNLDNGERRVVLITHDESTFYCCEGRSMMWMENGKNKLLPKTRGTSIMVSGFCCDCHGFFSDGVNHSIKLFEAGKNREGWYTNAHLVDHFETEVMGLIKTLHPNCDIVIAFDNSMTHHAKVPNGLDVGNLKMSDGMSSTTKVLMKPGWYKNDNGDRVIQSMQHENGVQKGVQSILSERGKHRNAEGKNLILQCKECKSKILHDQRSDETRSNVCCASYVLSQEEDFMEQEEWLAEVVKKAGFNIIFYPKYHCELNYIEMVWGWAKSYHRRTCTYNYKDLKSELPTTLLETCSVACFRRFFRYCLRFMSGYREGLEGPLLDYTMKKYRSHRCVPTGLKTLLEADFREYKAKKSTKSNRR